MKFEKYHIAKEIKKSLEENGFIRPTDIQYKSIPPIMAGEDVLAIAQTGTGKTAAFAIPVLDKLLQLRPEHYISDIKCLVLVPTRELAIQITEVFEKLGKYTSLKTLCITGGLEQEAQIAQLNKGVNILVATPGRMFDLIYQKHIKITKVEILVLDEADRMLDLGFIKDIQDVKKFLPKVHQTLFFSATINEEIKDIAYSLVRNPIRIQISPKDPVSKNVTHSVAFISMDDKRFFLERLVRENPESKILVFVRTQVRAERVHQAMERVGIKSLSMHGGKGQEDRSEVMKEFRAGTLKLVIATDVSARGIDIPDINYVVNYDLPEVAENYVHRVGRTGRGQSKGFAVSFCSMEEKDVLEEIESFLGKEIKVMEIKSTDYTQTLDFTEDTNNNWKALLKEAEKEETEYNKKKKKKK
ncbi:MAG TPA: DEAD/DEAH box helicase [Cytophagaceae bacterium]|jgi:ATP-dependent RNA helicase RhlE|nr:DEAD/DEAH box helicase [Cytophagaceae bacterium]